LGQRGKIVYTALPRRDLGVDARLLQGALIIGSNAFGIEEVGGIRQHAIAHYLDMVEDGRIDLSGLLTHRFALENWWDAVRALAHPRTVAAQSGVRTERRFADLAGGSRGHCNELGKLL